MHDITYQYGFTEEAGNFQNNDFNNGGVGHDAVIIENAAQGTNNAYFMCPPDGQPGQMAMFKWTRTSPGRWGALENSIPMHEYGHGVTNRMTGGSRNGQCLQKGEAGSMGEGWSDTFAVFLQRTESDNRKTDVTMGDYVIGDKKGIRTYPYSTDLSVNPLRYSDLNWRTEPHLGGEVWATILNELYWNLVDKIGFSSNWYDALQIKGNIVALQVVLGGVAIQPCNPTFLNARDAIIQAEKNYYGGAYACDIWRAFAKRGMGMDAAYYSGRRGFENGFNIPYYCQ